MSWKPTHRWVGSYYEVVKSETRQPTDETESGYVSREFRATPVLSILNLLADRVWLYVSFYNFDGVPQLELSAQGGLDQRTSDQFASRTMSRFPSTSSATRRRGRWTKNGGAGLKSTPPPRSIPTPG